MKRLLAILLSLLLLCSVSAQDWGHADVTMYIYDLDSCRSVAELNIDAALTPASVLKLVTTASVLEKYGGEKTISTFVTTDGNIDENGTLKGNLYVRGALDPTLESKHIVNKRFFVSLIDTLVVHGVKRIEGDVVADGSIVRNNAVSPKWLFEDLSSYYGVGCYGISVYDNIQSFTIRSHNVGDPASYSVQYPETQVRFIDRLNVVRNKTFDVHFYNMPYSNDVLIEGEIGRNSTKAEPLALSNPVLFMALRTKRLLEERGITVSGIGREGKAVGKTLLYEHVSPAMASIIMETNYKSNNHYAEHLFRLLGVNSATSDTGATTSDAIRTIRRIWQERGVDLSSLVMFDGNGLSPMDVVSSRQMVLMLNHMWRTKNNYFFNSLPLCGKEGTVNNFFTQTSFYVHAKSGSMTGVQSYAGYVDSNGHNYSFCIIVNGFANTRRKEIRSLIERTLTNAICDYEDTL